MKKIEEYLMLAKERPHLFTNEGLEVILDKDVIEEFEANGGREIGIAYESPWRYLLVDLVRNSAGKLFAYERVVPVKTGGVAILPVYDGEIVLIREYRHPVQGYRWEIPRGFGSQGITSRQNAAKELAEETGIKSAKFRQLGKMNTDSGLTSDQVDLFLAEVEELSISLENKERTEAIERVRLFSKEEIREMIRDHEMVDSFTLSALSIYLLD